MIQKISLLLIWLPVAAVLHSQDMHLSNDQMAGQLFNPALTGAACTGNARVGVFYRQQWAGIPEGYTTMGASGEWKKRQLSLGAQVYKNPAGEASLKTTGVLLSGAYHKPLGVGQTLSFGLALGHLQKSLNPALFTYDQQYVDGQGYDKTLASGESLALNRIGALDAQIGLAWHARLDKKGRARLHTSAALTHWQLPNESFLGAVSPLPRRLNARAGLEFDLTPMVSLNHDLWYQQQGQHREIVVGTRVSVALPEHKRLHLGGAFRLRDAFIGQAALDLGRMSLYLAYDAQVSPLSAATGGKGAWELGVFYHLAPATPEDRDKDNVPDHRDQCPDQPGPAKHHGCPPEAKAAPVTPTDSDGDGVPDALDKCPLEPGLPCFYGCNDTDKDGVLDRDDSCPDLFGPPENNGCPTDSRDSDRDGIPDDEDYCVFLKGQKTFHGCPDSDQDGVSDIDDQCPYIKGEKTNRGCPAGAGPETAAELPPLSVEFEVAAHYIRPLYQAQLAQWAQALRGKPYQRIIVAGHTDAEGTPAYNYALGLRRATAVRDFLRDQGLPVTRMEILSYGEAMPKAGNQSVAGKAQNRRVEVVPLGRE